MMTIKKYICLVLLNIALYGIPRTILFSDVEPFTFSVMAMFVCGCASGSIGVFVLHD